MKGQSKESVRYVESVQKALEILECFQSHSALSLKEIGSITLVNKSRVMRLAGTMITNNYLVYDPEAELYRLGPKLLALGKSYEENNTLVSLGRPILQKLAGVTGESAALYVVDGLERLCVAREEGTQSIRFSIKEGERMELHAGAAGKLLLAFGQKELQETFLKNRILKRLTPRTIVNPKKFRQELKEIRKKGYALSFGERVLDSAALAAPVFDCRRRACAALSIAGPITRFLSEHIEINVRILLNAAQQLSRSLGLKD